MTKDDNILLCKVSYNWYQVIKSHYISNGSCVTNCWYTEYEESAHASKDEDIPQASSLTLFLVEEDGHQYIIGGGYFLCHTIIDIESCWNQFGVRSGYLTYQEFLKRAKEFEADISDPLNCYLCNGSFIFIKDKIIEIPYEVKINLDRKSRALVSANEPFGLFLKKVSLQRRVEQLSVNSNDSTWPGIYYKATMHKSRSMAAQFKARMLSIYDFKCAITGCTVGSVLSIAHIKTLYDDRYLMPDNALILRSDIHMLFSKGFITAYYDNDDTVLIRVSKRIKMDVDPMYKFLDGAKLTLPENREYWPNKEYLTWHNQVRFENWLKYGEFSLIDSFRSVR